MSFTGISSRNNGSKIVRAWFNELRTAGILVETFLGLGNIPETSVSVANTQSATAVAGLIVSSASYKSALVTAEIRRKTDSNEVIAVGTFALIYRNLTTTWEIAGENWKGDEHGVTLTVHATTGQVSYASDTLAGSSYAGTMKFRAITFNA